MRGKVEAIGRGSSLEGREYNEGSRPEPKDWAVEVNWKGSMVEV